MAFDIKEDCEVVAEALCHGFLQGRDLFIRELISAREEKGTAHSREDRTRARVIGMDTLQMSPQQKPRVLFLLQPHHSQKIYYGYLNQRAIATAKPWK